MTECEREITCSGCRKILKVHADGSRFRCDHCALVYDPHNIGWFDPIRAPVQPDDWEHQPADDPTNLFKVQWKYTPYDLERIRWGLLPRSMDEKWFVYIQDDHLYFYRSWTGLFCYRAKLEPEGITAVEMSQNLGNLDPEEHLKIVRWIIEYLMIGKEDLREPA
jgi:LSD1 subclass zinc finger protein